MPDSLAKDEADADSDESLSIWRSASLSWRVTASNCAMFFSSYVAELIPSTPRPILAVPP
ncbi:hypothetical protein D3C75_1228420 [compost metagenome]